MENVIRDDIIRVNFEGDALDGIREMLSGLDELKKAVGGVDDNDGIAKIKKSADGLGKSSGIDKAVKGFDKLKTAGSKAGRGIKSAFSKASNAVKSMAKQVDSTANTIQSKLFNVKSLLTGIAAGAVVKKSIDIVVDRQNITSQFEVLLGSAEAAQKRVSELTDFAGMTPFTRDEIFAASKQLQVFAGNAISTGDSLRVIGDVAAGTGQPFEEVALWVGRLYDKLKSDDKVGEMTARLQEMGAISGEDRDKIEALVKSGKDMGEKWDVVEGIFGRFDGTMEKMSNNLGNMLTSLKSFATNSIFLPIGEGIADGLQPAIQRFREFRKSNKSDVDAMGELFKKFLSKVCVPLFSKIETGAETAIKAVGLLQNGVGSLAKLKGRSPLLDGIINAILWIKDHKNDVVSTLKSIAVVMAGIVGLSKINGLVSGLKSMINPLGAVSVIAGLLLKDYFDNGGSIEGLFKKLMSIVRWIEEFVKKTDIIESGKKLLSRMIPILQNVFESIGKTVGGFLMDHAETIGKLAPYLLGAIGTLKLLGKIIPLFSRLGSSKGGMVKTISAFAKLKVKNTAKAIGNLMIIVGGLGLLLWTAKTAFPNGVDFSEMFQVIALVGILEVIGSKMATFVKSTKKIKLSAATTAVLKITVIMGWLGLLLYDVTQAFSDGVDFSEMLQVIALVGILGIVGVGLAELVKKIGKLKLSSLGVIGVMGLILFELGLVLGGLNLIFHNGIKFTEMFQVITLIGVLGTVGAILTSFIMIVSEMTTVGKLLGKRKKKFFLDKSTIANIVTVIITMGAIMLAMGLVLGGLNLIFHNGIKFTEMFQVITLIGLLGTIGLGLTKLIKLIGTAELNVALARLSEIGLVIGTLGLLLFGLKTLFPNGVSFTEMFQVITLISILTIVGIGLSKLITLVGVVDLGTVLKGILGITLVIGAMGALLFAVAKAFPKGVDFSEMLQVVTLIGILGTVGSALTVLAGIIGTIALVPGGFAAIIAGIGSMSAVILAFEGLVAACVKIAQLITGMLPEIAENIAEFAEKLKPVFTAFDGINGENLKYGLTAISGFLIELAQEKILEFFSGKVDLGDLGRQLSKFGKKSKDFFDTIAGVKKTAFSNMAELFNTLAGIKGLPKSGGVVQWFAGDAYKGLKNMAEHLPKLGVAVDEFYSKNGGKSDFSAISNLLNSLSAVKGLPKDGGIFDWADEDVYKGLDTMMSKLPKLAESALSFYSVFNSNWNDKIPDFSAIGKLLNALSEVQGLPEDGGIWDWADEDVYKGLDAMMSKLPDLARSALSFYDVFKPTAVDFPLNFDKWDEQKNGGVPDFSAISDLLNALAEVKEFPKSGILKLAGLKESEYNGLKTMISMLAELAGSVKSFHENLDGMTDFSAISNILNALADVKSLPKGGGFTSYFKKDVYKGLEKMIDFLPKLSSAVTRFYNGYSGTVAGFQLDSQGIGNLTEFSVISNLFNALSDIKALPKDTILTGDVYDGLKDLATILPELGKAVGDFYSNVSKLPAVELTNLTYPPTFDSFKNPKQSIDFSAITDLLNAFGALSDKFARIGTEAGTAVTGLDGVTTAITDFYDVAGDFFIQLKLLDLEKLNGLWESLKGAKGIAGDALSTVVSNIDAIVSKVSELPQKMANGIASGGTALANAFYSIWTKAVSMSAVPVNKLIGGANWILEQFGSDKRVAAWTPYANGTAGHKGGNALVNDGNGAELVQMPNGKAFIPQGRNVFIPNAPKGMKVLPAEQTAQLMGRKNPTFRYKNGVGDIDVFSFADNEKGLIDAVAGKYVNYDGLNSFETNISHSMVGMVKDGMISWAKKLFEEFGALSLANYDPSAGVEQWRSTVIRALKMEGLYSEANVARTLYQMQTESGGNPMAINLWDSNAKAGIPSKGLMQVIDPTFQSYAHPGYDRNIYDPLSNILAAVRYASSRYGSLAAAFQGHGYANGGIASKPSIFGEDGREMAIPLEKNRRKRGLDLWAQTGSMLGVKLPKYVPDGSCAANSSNSVENNTYSPVFNLTISGTTDDRSMARKIKRWVSEALNETFESYERKSAPVREV